MLQADSLTPLGCTAPVVLTEISGSVRSPLGAALPR